MVVQTCKIRLVALVSVIENLGELTELPDDHPNIQFVLTQQSTVNVSTTTPIMDVLRLGEVMDIKIEEVKIIYTYKNTETSTAFDEIITCVSDNQMLGEYTIVGYNQPIEYKITKEE